MKSKVSQMLHTSYGRLVISVLLGLGLASLFKKTCNSKSCYKFVAPNVSEITSSVYSHGDSCYTFKPITVQCKNKESILFA